MTSSYNLCRRTGQLNTLPQESFMKHIGPCPPGFVSVPVVINGEACTDWKFCIPKEYVMNGPCYPCDAVGKTKCSNLYCFKKDAHKQNYPKPYYATPYPKYPAPRYDGTGYEGVCCRKYDASPSFREYNHDSHTYEICTANKYSQKKDS